MGLVAPRVRSIFALELDPEKKLESDPKKEARVRSRKCASQIRRASRESDPQSARVRSTEGAPSDPGAPRMGADLGGWSLEQQAWSSETGASRSEPRGWSFKLGAGRPWKRGTEPSCQPGLPHLSGNPAQTGPPCPKPRSSIEVTETEPQETRMRHSGDTLESRQPRSSIEVTENEPRDKPM